MGLWGESRFSPHLSLRLAVALSTHKHTNVQFTVNYQLNYEILYFSIMASKSFRLNCLVVWLNL